MNNLCRSHCVFIHSFCFRASLARPSPQANADATDAANNDKQQADAAAMQQATSDLIANAQAAAADAEAHANDAEQLMTSDEMAAQEAARTASDVQAQVCEQQLDLSSIRFLRPKIADKCLVLVSM